MTSRIDTAAVRARHPLAAVIGRYVKLSRRGREHVGLCPFHAEKTPSFTIVEGKGFYHCFGCGAHGDVIGFVKEIEGVDFAEAVRRLEGDAPPVAARQVDHREANRREAAERKRRIRAAREMWRRFERDICGTPVERYLESRGLRRPRKGWPASLRYAPRLAYLERGDADDGTAWPCMVAAVQKGRGARAPIVAVHRTYLKPDGSGKAPVTRPKKMLGPVSGGAVRFAAPGPRLLVAEGIETALSVAQALPRRRVWAAGSLGNMAALAVPQGVRQVTLLMDADTKDFAVVDRVIEKAWRAYAVEGIRLCVAWPPPGCDFNDVLTCSAPGWPGEAERKRAVQ